MVIPVSDWWKPLKPELAKCVCCGDIVGYTIEDYSTYGTAVFCVPCGEKQVKKVKGQPTGKEEDDDAE